MALKELLGFGSQVSIWLGPPSSQRRMQACALAAPFAAMRLWSRRNWLKLIPNRLSEPARRKQRRFGSALMESVLRGSFIDVSPSFDPGFGAQWLYENSRDATIP